MSKQDEGPPDTAPAAVPFPLFQIFSDAAPVQVICCREEDIEKKVDEFVERAKFLGYDLKNVTFIRKK